MNKKAPQHLPSGISYSKFEHVPYTVYVRGVRIGKTTTLEEAIELQAHHWEVPKKDYLRLV